MFAKIILLTFLIAVASATEGWRNCASDGAQITKLEIQSCPKTPCTFGIAEYNVSLAVVLDRVTYALAYAAMYQTPLGHIPIGLGDACLDLPQGSCPTSVGSEIAFNMVLKNAVPNILNTTAFAFAEDDAKDVVFCFEFDVNLVPF